MSFWCANLDGDSSADFSCLLEALDSTGSLEDTVSFLNAFLNFVWNTVGFAEFGWVSFACEAAADSASLEVVLGALLDVTSDGSLGAETSYNIFANSFWVFSASSFTDFNSVVVNLLDEVVDLARVVWGSADN